MRKRPDITEQTRANLIDSFWDLLGSKNMDKITIKEITDHAGYYRSTFYEYFSDIADLVNQAEDQLISKIEKQAINSLSNNSMDVFISDSVVFYNANSKYLQIIAGSNRCSAFISKLKSVLHPLILQYLTSNSKNTQPDYLIEFALSGLLGTITYWFESQKNISIEDLTELINPIVKNILE